MESYYYRIILAKNKKKKKTLFQTNVKKNAFNKFESLLKKNIVLFSKDHVNYGTITPVKYEIVLLKRRTSGDTNRFIRNELGQVVEEKIDNPDWVILKSSDYKLEETFWVYGIEERLTASDIIKQILMKDIKKDLLFKEVIYAHNKLIIDDDNSFNLIICKNIHDAMKLHGILRKFCEINEIKNVLFLGHASPYNRVGLYRKIEKVTGWKRFKIWKTSTRT